MFLEEGHILNALTGYHSDCNDAGECYAENLALPLAVDFPEFSQWFSVLIYSQDFSNAEQKSTRKSPE